MFLIRFSCLLCLFTANTRASSHWVVTESGLIRSKEDSPFAINQPFDLLSFLNQETRWTNIFNIYDDLLVRQRIINSLWTQLEEQSDITAHISKNEHCRAVGEVEVIDWYATLMEDGKSLGILEREFLLYAIEEFGNSDVPDCKKISSLTFSMSAFEHLEGMMNRGQLNATAEPVPPKIFSSVRTIDQYGHWLTEVLRRNTSSWLHYNLAAIYWRIKGNVPKALECSRRAVHYSPRHYKAIPLLGMGSILHRSQKTDDAIVVLGASVDHAPKFPISHLTLGQVYAVAGDFNSSIKHLNTSIKLKEDFELAKQYQRAVLCHLDMFTKMQYAQRTLNKLNIELEEFEELEIQWFRIHAALLKTMKHEKEYNYEESIKKNCVKIEEITNLKIRDLQKDSERNALVQFLVTDPKYVEDWRTEKGVAALKIALDLEKAVKRTAKETGPPNKNLMGYSMPIVRNKTIILKELGPMPQFPNMFPHQVKYSEKSLSADKGASQPPEITLGQKLELALLKKADNGKLLYPSTMKLNRNKMDFDTDPDWPSKEFCQTAKKDFPDTIDTVFPVFLPFEHKGISLKSVLTERIGISAVVEHELPWHPPLCPSDRELTVYTAKKGNKVQMVTEAVAKEFLRFKLLSYVSHEDYEIIKNREDAEIGHRIYIAIQKKLASKWVLYTLASLYWRVRGNIPNALNCLLTANRIADTRYKDVVSVSLASIFLEMGLWDDSLEALEEAHKMNPYEPPTNFLIAQLHMVKKNQIAQFFHLKQVLRVEPYFMSGYARNLLNSWACIAKQVNKLKELGVLSADIDGEKDICAETEPGVSMVCARDGTNCRLTNRHCNPGPSRESSTLIRMLELAEDETKQRPRVYLQPLEMSLNKAILIKPKERYDKLGHQRSYDLMISMIKEQVDACRHYGCGVNVELLNLKREECSYNVFELQYWLHYVSFQLELDDSELQMSADISAMVPSNKKVPECRMPLDIEEDFFLWNILKVDTDGWSTLPTLMRQFGELFSHDDHGLLGAKLAKYLDTKPRMWTALIAAGWWCGAAGRGACAARCLAAAHALAPTNQAHLALRPLQGLLHLQSKSKDAMEIAYLSLYTAPKSKEEAFLVGLAHYYKDELNEALWMYRYALAFDYNYVPATACLHTGMCHLVFGKDGIKQRQKHN